MLKTLTATIAALLLALPPQLWSATAPTTNAGCTDSTGNGCKSTSANSGCSASSGKTNCSSTEASGCSVNTGNNNCSTGNLQNCDTDGCNNGCSTLEASGDAAATWALAAVLVLVAAGATYYFFCRDKPQGGGRGEKETLLDEGPQLAEGNLDLLPSRAAAF